MYSEIEREYQRQNEILKFNRLYYFTTLFLGGGFSIAILIFAKFKTFGFVLSFFIAIIIALAFILIYWERKSRQYLTKEELANVFSFKLVLLRKAIEKKNKSILVKLLKRYNVTSREDIKIMISHYQTIHYVPFQNCFFSNFANYILGWAGFVFLFYSEDLRTFDMEKVKYCCYALLPFVAGRIMIYLPFKMIASDVKMPRQKLYFELEQQLTEIYMNYNLYKNKLNDKHSFFEKIIKKIRS